MIWLKQRLLVRPDWRRQTALSQRSQRRSLQANTPRYSLGSTTARVSGWWKFTTEEPRKLVTVAASPSPSRATCRRQPTSSGFSPKRRRPFVGRHRKLSRARDLMSEPLPVAAWLRFRLRHISVGRPHRLRPVFTNDKFSQENEYR
jgi:hypothetical protein